MDMRQVDCLRAELSRFVADVFASVPRRDQRARGNCREQGFGHFVNTLSTAGLRIVPLQSVYAGTKNAVRTISEGLRQEAGDSLRVTVVSPGVVRTDFAEHRDPAVKAQIDKMMEIALSPDAVARAIAFAIEQPDGVDVGDIVVRPTAQG
ncbi:SDR family oxidoreductase [Streptomyces lunaelactis]|uniref:SDR family oxidoreductase n=2 Tax=Streptomyces lunaelactis TaxID=1535768 RepID=UPI00281563F4|nr:SDR family NAD(P)-dependent oxidoreductase [Streptomyces lunaelactis]